MTEFLFEAVRSGVTLCEVPAYREGEITCDASAALKKSIRCRLAIPEEVDFLTDRLRVSLVQDGERKVLGTFLLTTAEKRVSDAGAASWDCEGYDLGYLPHRSCLEKRSDAFFKAGSKYTDAITALLVESGVDDIAIPASEAAFSADREDWEVGESRLTIINTLLGEINYTSLWFDRYGTARAEVYRSPVGREVQRRYRAGADSVIARAHTVSTDTFTACNVFPVLYSSADSEEAIYAVSVNDDPASKLSTVNRGRIVAPVTRLDGTADQTTAQAYADNLKFRSMISTETAEISTEASAEHGVLDILEIQLPELSGKWEETAWTLPLRAGEWMRHTMRRAIYV